MSRLLFTAGSIDLPHRCAARLRLSAVALSVGLLSLNNPIAFAASPASGPTVSVATIGSDQAAIQAMQNVIVQSGGLPAWQGLHSAEETFAVSIAGDTTNRTLRLLEDWSSDAVHYRTATQGQAGVPVDHNGGTTFAAKNPLGQPVAVPEFDQARTLVHLLPAAAAEVMLRRTEYVLKVSTIQKCNDGSICVDVFRNVGRGTPQIPEQRWEISATTGLPISVKVQLQSIGRSWIPLWKDVRFLQYGVRDGLNIPIAIEVIKNGDKGSWTLLSLKPNPGFSPSTFDQETGQ